MTTGQFLAADNKTSRGIASGLFRNVRIGSFDVKKNPSDGLWYLMLNKTRLVAKDLPSRDHAFSLLHGIFTSKGASTEGMNKTISDMLANGRATADEVIHDTYNLAGGNWVWESARSWWAHIHHGTWTSTETTTGTYLKVDPGSRVRGSFIQFSADDPINNGVSLPTGAKLRFTVTPSTGGVITLIEGTPPAAGDSRWTWIDSGGNNLVIVDADMESGGNFGWDPSDSVKIELFTE